ncbi:hypothetical protein SADUNF_Sadunf10G0120600 [Salix dunnii]|uniref:Uncharacterized protein n=1 Tax=Salix dunnii TaxID=1413687 RepID=A0A835JTP6_9ROSI|nr:hypothetical protein SADUNF_Sadunf10G0120600 [Salix dunnii]
MKSSSENIGNGPEKATSYIPEEGKDKDAELIENLKTEKEDDGALLTVEIQETIPAQNSSFLSKRPQCDDVSVRRIGDILNDFWEEIEIEGEMINEREGGSVSKSGLSLQLPGEGDLLFFYLEGVGKIIKVEVSITAGEWREIIGLDLILLETTGLANPAPLATVLGWTIYWNQLSSLIL